MPILIFFFVYLFRIFPILFVVHLLHAVVSPSVRVQIQRYPVFHFCWFVLSVVVALVAIFTARGGG